MNKIALITDTASDIGKEAIEKYNIKVLPFRIIYKDREYKDRVDITPDEVYKNMKTEVPKTSIPGLCEIEKVFENLKKEGFTHVIAIHLSSSLSGIVNAVSMISNSFPEIKTHIYDSKSISVGEGVLVERCAELIQKGKSFDEIVEAIQNIKSRMKLYFVIDTLEYLKKGGRIGRISSTIGEVLNIKPIVSIDDEGRYYTYAKIRGRRQSINKLIEIGTNIIKTCKCRVYINHGGALDEAKRIQEAFSRFSNVISITVGDISPVASVHSGPGLVGVAFLREV